jgi:hypothetical protein
LHEAHEASPVSSQIGAPLQSLKEQPMVPAGQKPEPSSAVVALAHPALAPQAWHSSSVKTAPHVAQPCLSPLLLLQPARAATSPRTTSAARALR